MLPTAHDKDGGVRPGQAIDLRGRSRTPHKDTMVGRMANAMRAAQGGVL